MSTTTPLTDSINNLTTYANSVTGASDTNLSDAVATLASGYGQGGGGEDTLSKLCNGTLTRIDDDNIIKVSSQLLRGSSFVQEIFLKNCENLASSYCFASNSICVIVLPSLDTVINNGYYFSGGASLQHIDIGENLSGIASNTFNGASGLENLVIRRTATACTLNNVNAFNGTPFASNGTGGTLYVPSALISSYQSASNWSTILGYTNNQIKSIESTHTDPNAPIDLTLYYADGTPIT